jgi:hypothetical protein
MNVHVIYRLSDVGTRISKPPYINWKNCLFNFIKNFKYNSMILIADNVNSETKEFLENLIRTNILPECKLKHSSLGNSQSFLYALDLATEEFPGNSVIYFVEDDYLHRANSRKILEEGLELADYVTLYDHRDKYMQLYYNYAELSYVFLSESTHWKTTASTTMTFATSLTIIQEDKEIIKKFLQNKIPIDNEMFLELGKKGRTVISPIPGYSTHGDIRYLSPLIDWEQIAKC